MRKVSLVIFVLLLFLPLSAHAADGRNRPKHKKFKHAATVRTAGCNSRKLSAKAKRACEARAAAAERRREEIARRRAEEARRRAIAFEMSLHKQTADNIVKDKTEGEDPKVRTAALTALGSNAGTVIVMETKTGKVLAAVNQEWAFRQGFEPCSTIKLVTTVAGLKEEMIDEDDDAAQGDLKDALANSQNWYFQNLGVKVGYPKLIDTAKKLGLGQPTGINSPGESPGKLPLVQKTAKLYSHGYGFKITPLQQAVLTSIIANHGIKVTPYIPTKSGVSVQKTETVDLPVKDLDGVIPGMQGSAEYGTAHRGGVDATLGIAGKTGTCQATGTFTSFGPTSNPKYTVVVVIRGAAGKGRVAAGIAGKVYQELLPSAVMPIPTSVPVAQKAKILL